MSFRISLSLHTVNYAVDKLYRFRGESHNNRGDATNTDE